MYLRIPLELVPGPLGSAEHTLGTTALQPILTVCELEILVGVLIVWVVTTGYKCYTCLRNVKTSIYQMTFFRIFIQCRIVGCH